MNVKNKKFLYKLSIPRLSCVLETNINNLSNLLNQNDISIDNIKKIESLIKFGKDININLKRYAVSDMKCSISNNIRKVNNKSIINSIINQVFTFLMSTISIRSMLLQSTSK